MVERSALAPAEWGACAQLYAQLHETALEADAARPATSQGDVRPSPIEGLPSPRQVERLAAGAAALGFSDAQVFIGMQRGIRALLPSQER
jgi:hypothetical protein